MELYYWAHLGPRGRRARDSSHQQGAAGIIGLIPALHDRLAVLRAENPACAPTLTAFPNTTAELLTANTTAGLLAVYTQGSCLPIMHLLLVQRIYSLLPFQGFGD